MLRSDEYGNVYDDGQPNDSQQQYLMGYIPGEGGGGSYSQILNPNYAPTEETLDNQARAAAADAEYWKLSLIHISEPTRPY